MSYVIPPGSHRIPMDEAYSMIERYQKNMSTILNPELVASNILPISETFRKEAILEYLSREDVACFRIYYGMSPNMEIHSLIVGVDKDGHDILPPTGSVPGNDPAEPAVFEDAIRCPTACPPPGGPFTTIIRG